MTSPSMYEHAERNIAEFVTAVTGREVPSELALQAAQVQATLALTDAVKEQTIVLRGILRKLPA